MSDTEEDQALQDHIRSRANRSVAILEAAMARAMGRYTVLHPGPEFDSEKK